MTEEQWQKKWERVKAHGEALEMYTRFVDRGDLNIDTFVSAAAHTLKKEFFNNLKTLISEMPQLKD